MAGESQSHAGGSGSVGRMPSEVIITDGPDAFASSIRVTRPPVVPTARGRMIPRRGVAARWLQQNAPAVFANGKLQAAPPPAGQPGIPGIIEGGG